MNDVDGEPVESIAAAQPGGTWWLELALVGAVLFIVGGAPAPHVNETHYLTKAKHYWDPSYCPGDFFLDSADPHLSFYWTVGWLTKFCSLTATAWIGRAAAWGLLAVSWMRLARAVTTTRWAASLAAALWLVIIHRINFAGEWVAGGVEAKCFAYACVLCGLAAIARGQWKTPWIWFGAASALHVLVGAWAVLGGLSVWITESRCERPALRSLLPGLIIGGLLSLPGLLPALALERGADPQAGSEAARIYVFDRLPHHLAPLSLAAPERAQRLIKLAELSTAFAALCAWMWFRALADREYAQGELANFNQRALNRIARFAGFSLACVGVGLAVEAALVDRPLTAAKVLRYYWFRQADVAVPLAIAFGLTCMTVTLLQRPSRLARSLALLPIAWCLVELGALAAGRWRDSVPPGAARIEDLADWQDACRWIAENTPPDSLFLVPRAAQSFKWYASRADVANRKDVPQDAASVLEWRRRCQELFPVVDQFGESKQLAYTEELGAARVRELAQEFGVDYLIAQSFPPLDLPVVYPANPDKADSAFTIYRLNSSTPDPPQ